MIKPAWAIAGVALLGTASIAGAVIVASPGGEEEVVQQVETATPAASSSPSPQATPTASAIDAPTPTATASVPGGWVPYTDAVNAFAFSYPGNWSIEPDDGNRGSTRIASFDLTTWNSQFPPGGIGVELSRLRLEQVDPRPTEATDTVIAGLPAWEIAGRRADFGGDATWAWFHTVAVERHEYRYYVAGYFGKENPDEATFVQIVNSFAFAD